MYAELKQKICSRCKKDKAINLFYKIAGGTKPRPECKECTNSYHKKYRSTENGIAATKKARDAYLARPTSKERDSQNKREWARFKKYGLTKYDYNKMLELQNYRCAICEKHHKNCKNGLVVDHCHKTGTIRKLLCNHCNRGLGFFLDNSNIIYKAAAYLYKFKK